MSTTIPVQHYRRRPPSRIINDGSKWNCVCYEPPCYEFQKNYLKNEVLTAGCDYASSDDTFFFFGPCIWLSLLLSFYRNQTSNASSRSAEVCIYKERKINESTVAYPHPFHKVVLLKSGPSTGNIAVITEIIDHNRVTISLSPRFLMYGILTISLGHNRWSNDECSPPIIPIQTSHPHTSLPNETPSCCWYWCREKASGKRSYRWKVE